MRITSNTLHERLLNELGRLSAEQAQLTQRLATGRRVNEASEDPALAGRVIGYSTQKRMLQQFDRNALITSQGLAVGAAHLNSIHKITAQAISAAPSAAMASDPVNRAVFVRQIDNMIEQAVGLSNGQHNNNYLFGAAASDAAPFTTTRDLSGRITSVAYGGDPGASPGANVGEGVRVTTGTSGVENAQVAGLINNLVALRDAIEAGDETLIGTAQNGVSDSQDELVGMLAGLVLSQSRIELHRVQNTSRFNELAGLISSETDTNVAETIIQFQQNGRNYQAALATGARIMQQSLLDFLR